MSVGDPPLEHAQVQQFAQPAQKHIVSPGHNVIEAKINEPVWPNGCPPQQQAPVVHAPAPPLSNSAQQPPLGNVQK